MSHWEDTVLWFVPISGFVECRPIRNDLLLCVSCADWLIYRSIVWRGTRANYLRSPLACVSVCVYDYNLCLYYVIIINIYLFKSSPSHFDTWCTPQWAMQSVSDGARVHWCAARSCELFLDCGLIYDHECTWRRARWWYCCASAHTHSRHNRNTTVPRAFCHIRETDTFGTMLCGISWIEARGLGTKIDATLIWPFTPESLWHLIVLTLVRTHWWTWSYLLLLLLLYYDLQCWPNEWMWLLSSRAMPLLAIILFLDVWILTRRSLGNIHGAHQLILSPDWSDYLPLS